MADCENPETPDTEEMEEVGPLRFYVLAENEAVAVAHVSARGYPPMGIERDDDRFVVLVFHPKPYDQLFGLVQALPNHLNAKVGIITGSRPPFASETKT